MDVSTPDTHHNEFDALMEVARRLEVWASEVEKPASRILRSLAANLRRCATRLLIVGTDLAISKILAEEKAQRTEILVRAESLPPWVWPFYLERLARRAEHAHLFHTIERLSCAIDPTG
jgi:hypothetical protein